MDGEQRRKVVKILVKDDTLVQKWPLVFKHLTNNTAFVGQLERRSHVNTYLDSIFDEVIQFWVSKNGSIATLSALAEFFRTEDLFQLAGKQIC